MSLNERYNRNNIFQHVAGHLPKNRRNFTFAVLDNMPLQGTFGKLDARPCEGKVIVVNDDAFIVLSPDKKDIRVVDRRLATCVPEIGDTVRVLPYRRCDFEGFCVSDSKPEICTMDDGSTYTVNRMVLGGNGRDVKLPVPKAECHELKSLIELMETAPLPDGFRMLMHMLVDSKARDFSIVDPKPKDIIKTPPAVLFTVETSKHCGQVRVFYNRGLDSFGIELLQDGLQTYFNDSVFFDELTHRLYELIDDGTWNRIDVEVIAAAKKPRKAKALPLAA